MSKFLDLRDKGINNVKIVERIIFKPRSFGAEMLRLFSVIVIVLAIGFGVSNADNLNPFSESGIETASENFSVLGVVSEISEDAVVVTNAKGSDKSGDTTYTLDIEHLEKVETQSYSPLIITDIKIGDTIIAQGLTNGNTFFIKRIVTFGGGVELVQQEVATTTIDIASTTIDTASTTDGMATTTDDTATSTSGVGGGEGAVESTASTTDDTATSTTEETENASTTETDSDGSGIIDAVGDVVDTVVDTVTDVVETVIDAVTGNSDQDEVQEEPQQEQSAPKSNEETSTENSEESSSEESVPEPII